MNYRRFGKTDWKVSEVSLGTWQLGARWGDPFDEKTAERTLEEAFNQGINFFDTADVYNNRASEKAVGKFIKKHSEKIYMATKCGRFINPHIAEGYTVKALREYVETSLKNSGLETLDLIQLHCPPTEVYSRPEIFELFKDLKKEGKIQHLGVSVEKVEEALKAIEYDNVVSVQIIFNMFRLKPSEEFFAKSAEKDTAIIVRVPLASGLLTGKFSKSTQFSKDDHRFFNRKGEAFDKGETFSGVPFETGLEAVEELKKILGGKMELSLAALRFILDFPEVSTVIPGASKPEQISRNTKASEISSLDKETISAIKEVYNSRIKPLVHHLW